jgi:uncharacterized membrane protein YphA (DoxX/SURF4 family)
MKKITNIIYWISTLWLSLGMTSTGLVQIFHMTAKVDFITQLGYPGYFLTMLGVWKILGVIAILIPRFLLLKEWAYAGFFFLMSGAVISHIAHGDPMKDMFPSLLLLTLIIISWLTRPSGRRILLANHINKSYESQSR